MRLNRNQYRAVCAVLIIVAFFIPAYRNVSAFNYLWLAINARTTDTELTLIDLAVVLLPLLLIPVAAIMVLVRALKRKTQNTLLLCLPLFSLFFFFLILSFDISRQVSNLNTLELLKQMSVGFYVAALASVFLLLTYSKREAFNLHIGHR
jgi:hypothetical protein